ncbi:hypothetical protein IAQ61_008178 [Plenodomus lingam]|uniref:uncharacterized protein n=1 Tax=Leptosphaeria maculans TaxID=5022 RepID=UPI00331672BA|nr:hypothetical protein IAQ61_008178 [Plenodomus lingam]
MPPTISAVVSLPSLTQAGAQTALEAAEQYALEIGVPMSIAVVDAHAHLLSFTRMDGAKITSINTAMDMAFTSASNRIPTSAYHEDSWSNCAASGTSGTLCGRFTSLGGGMPILSSTGDILGAIGCSTGNSMQVEAAAKSGRDAVLALVKREKAEEERRIAEERHAVLSLWKEKEEEVEILRDHLESMERGSKRMRFDDGGSGNESISSSGRGSVIVGGPPGTPPEEREIQKHQSFIGEVTVGRR